jgi:hypothetical protein
VNSARVLVNTNVYDGYVGLILSRGGSTGVDHAHMTKQMTELAMKSAECFTTLIVNGAGSGEGSVSGGKP